jgi:uncharacterized protein
MSMRIIVDGDGCPQNARKICEEYAGYYGLEMIVVFSHDHNIQGDFSCIIVDKGKDSTDFRVVEISGPEDIVITQDYGLASLLLTKVHAIINPTGFQYTIDNIDHLLMKRFMGQKIRRGGGRTKGPKKRKREEDIQFEEILVSIIQKFNA